MTDLSPRSGLSLSLEKAARQALEALELRCSANSEEREPYGAITALRQALEQPAQQVGCEGEDGLLRIHSEYETCDVCKPAQREDWGPGPHEHHSLPEQPDHIPDAGEMVEQPAQQEPVARANDDWSEITFPLGKVPAKGGDLYTRPQSMTPLTETLSSEWTPCIKLPVVVHVRKQRPGESHVSTREGITPVNTDDLIMRGVSGEEYPIGRAIFEQTYSLDTSTQAPAIPLHGEPLTQQEVVDGFCKQPHDVQFVSVFNAGVRFAEAAHGITSGAATLGEKK